MNLRIISIHLIPKVVGWDAIPEEESIKTGEGGPRAELGKTVISKL